MADIEIEKIQQRELRQSKNEPAKPNQASVKFPEAGIKISATAKEKGPRIKHERMPLITDISRSSSQPSVQEESADNQEQEWSRDFTKDRRQNLSPQRFKNTSNEIIKDLNEPNLDLQNSEELNELKKAIKSKSPKRIQAAGKKISSKLSGASAVAGFATFIISVGLASIKDIIDFISTFTDVGLIGAAVNFIVTGALALILIAQGSSLKRAGVLKKYVKRYGITAVVEFIPIISFAPLWVLAVILARRETMKKRRAKQAANVKLKNSLKKINGGRS